MKRLLLSTILIAASAHAVYAATDMSNNDAVFSKSQQLYNAKNYTAAFQELDRIAKTGNPQAIYNSAFMIEQGQGTTKDPKKAFELYQQASDKGYGMASYRLAQIHSGGELGQSKDMKKGRSYLEKAANQGVDEATIEVAMLLFSEDKPASTQLALQKLAPLIQKGNMQAMHAKAVFDISQGFKLQNKDIVNSGLKSIQDLAVKGYVPALFAVANLYTNGKIVPQNLPEARKIFAALAANNVPQAKESLAVVDKLIADQAKAPAKK